MFKKLIEPWIRRAYNDGWDDGELAGRANATWLILKDLDRAERTADSTPNLYTADDVRKMVQRWSK